VYARVHSVPIGQGVLCIPHGGDAVSFAPILNHRDNAVFAVYGLYLYVPIVIDREIGENVVFLGFEGGRGKQTVPNDLLALVLNISVLVLILYVKMVEEGDVFPAFLSVCQDIHGLLFILMTAFQEFVHLDSSVIHQIREVTKRGGVILGDLLHGFCGVGVTDHHANEEHG
jgi:hypothetical protein